MKMHSSLALATVACFVIFVGSASAASKYFASPAGGGNPALCDDKLQPCTLAQALALANASDDNLVSLAPGTYSVGTKIALNRPETIDGSGSAAATTLNWTGNGSSGAIVELNDAGALVTDLTLSTPTNNAALNMLNGTASRIVATSPAALYTCTGIHGKLTNSLCKSTQSDGTGFGIASSMGYADPNLTFVNDSLIGFSFGHGLSYTSGAFSNTVIAATNTIFRSGLSGVFLDQINSTQTLQFSVDHSSYSAITKGSGAGTVTQTIGAGNQTSVAPIFTDENNFDYTEDAASPTIDAGAVVANIGASDLAGHTRNQGAAPDIGAFEFASPVVEPPTGSPSGSIADHTAPTIKIVKKPKSKTTSKKLKVVFKANETATFLCKLDKGKFKTCKSPYKKRVKLGRHKLQIRATDPSGNVSVTKSVQWEVHK